MARVGALRKSVMHLAIEDDYVLHSPIMDAQQLVTIPTSSFAPFQFSTAFNGANGTVPGEGVEITANDFNQDFNADFGFGNILAFNGAFSKAFSIYAKGNYRSFSSAFDTNFAIENVHQNENLKSFNKAFSQAFQVN